MAARDYTLAVTPLTNSIRICKTSKKNPNMMTSDFHNLPETVFIGCIMEWANNKIPANSDTQYITVGGKVVAEIKIDRVALGIKKAPKKVEKESQSPNGAIAENEK